MDGYKQGRLIAKKLERAIIIADCWVRIGACEVTCRGMKERDMLKIAELMKTMIVDSENSQRVGKDIIRLTKDFQETEYCFR